MHSFHQILNHTRLQLIHATSAILLSTAVSASTPNDTLHLDWMDSTNSPCQDFYRYANGTWQKQNPIPSEQASWSVFALLEEKNKQRIHEMLEQLANQTQPLSGHLEQKVGDFYVSGMNEEEIERLGIRPLKADFDAIEQIKDKSSLASEIARLQLKGVNVLFAFGSIPDFKDSKQTIAALMQAGLSLPDKEYYLNKQAALAHIRDEYIKHLTKMFILLGETPSQASQHAHTVMTIETEIAKASLSKTALQNPQKIYHIMSKDELKQLAPQFAWSTYFSTMGHADFKKLNVATPTFFKKVIPLLDDISLAQWKTYLRWRLLDDSAPFLSKPFVDQNFHMVSVLTGVQTHRPRWKRVVATENLLLGFAIGELYVKKYFSEEAKQDVIEIIHQIRQALKDDITTLSWMTPTTRRAALKKLALIEEHVGYPEHNWDYSTLHINRDTYLDNVFRTKAFLVRRDLNKIDKPVDRAEWEMPPQVINAYYDPSMNSIHIPSGILQAPFYDKSAPAALNYGAIGFIIGHEITHGFDKQGAQFDEHGNLHNWWTEEDLKKFHQATQCIAKQFSTYTIAKDTPVRGNLVVGEATADLGGLILAYRAFHASPAYASAPTINGFTPDQQFFLSSAHIWAMNMRPEQALNQIVSDPHPPAQFRVNGTLANMPAFQAAFKLPKTCPLVRTDRCHIW